MHNSLIRKAAVLGAAAIALAQSPATAAEWTSFAIGQLNSFSFAHAHRPDGQFIFGSNGQLSIQTTFGAPGTTPVANTGPVTFDPSFIAIRSASEGLIGAGGFGGASGLYRFDPGAPGTSINSGALATLQNYAAAFWTHPTSGRQGWLIIGGNGTPGDFANATNLSFVSTDGQTKGALTGDLCSYSGGIDVDAAGNVFIALADVTPEENNRVIKFTADQVDGAVNGLLTATPATLTRSAATNVLQGDASSSLAVDSAGRIWLGGYQIAHLQAFDPATGVTRRFLPDHAPLPGASGPPSYAVRQFTRNGAGFVSFLANDSFYTFGSTLSLGYKAVADLHVRSVQFTATQQTVTESAGTVNVALSITPAPQVKVTVPLVWSGTATRGKDYTSTATSVTFEPGSTSKTVAIKVTNDIEDEPVDLETIILTLGAPAPVAQAGWGALGTEKFTLTISDDDVKPAIAAVQSFGTLKVGAPVNYQVVNTGAPALKWTASGLPPGLKIDAKTGIISGIPTAAEEYDQVWITATNAAGTSTSVALILNVLPFPQAATGSFAGLVDRTGTATGGLGARVSLTTTSKATYTGKIEIGKSSYAIKGVMDFSNADPQGTATFKHAGADLVLGFTLDSTTGVLAGTLPGGATLEGARALTSTSLTGPHNFAANVQGGATADVPEGATFGSVRVSASAIAAVTGVAADGTAYTSSGPLLEDGAFLVYQGLYKVPGSILGKATISANAARSVSGELTWSKPSQGSGNLYATGWASPLTLTVRGGKYRPAAGATLPMNLAPGATTNNARAILSKGGIGTLATDPLNLPFRISSTTAFAIASPHKLTFKNDTGLVTGTVVIGTGAAKKSLPVQALLVPDETTADPFDSRGEGFFLAPLSASQTRSGAVRMEPLP